MKRKIFSIFLSLLLLLSCISPALAAEETDVTREIIEIKSAEDFLSFAKNCTLDTWSQGKEFHLTADISLAGMDFTPIASFGGILEGNGHTISGLNLTKSLAPTGLIRYIQETGQVRNLTVTGTVAPGNDASFVGTLAGENQGTIENCSFSGTVEGNTATGGIVGINYGTITNCRSEGTITGKSQTGGIAGTNKGTISRCSNHADLNTAQVDPTIDITSIDLDFSLDMSRLSSWDVQAVATDTGGIAGHSTGTIQSCTNLGAIGYPSIGYNLGGIVGRNSGYIADCQNKSTIQGRKDVGGIAGQQEPEIATILSPDYLSTLSKQFEQLGGLVSSAGTTGAGMGGDIQSAIQSISAYQDSARSAVEGLLSGVGSGDLSGSADAIAKISSSIQGMVSATGRLKDAVGSGVADLTEDVNAISGQISSISRTFALATEDAQQEVVSDISDEEIEDIREGKIYNCTNQATVEADLNAGGIVGAMALESSGDPESDTLSGSGLQIRRYEVKAILQNCVNLSTVTGKRSYCGGICGRMELGTILACENYGNVTSTGGNYVGGISGNTAGRVRDCFAKCTLSGNKYVGGIVGNGTTQDLTGESSFVSNCYSMVDIGEATQYMGAISGGENGSFAQNFFCSDTLAGINSVSYGSMAEPISYDSLLQAEALPRRFQKLTLRFVADGETLKEQSFFFGDSFDSSIYPVIPEKEGYYALWDITDLRELHFDTVVTAQYFPRISALATADVRPEGSPVLFVQGQFQEGDYLSLQPGQREFTLSEHQTLLEHWVLSIPADGLESHTLRYLPEQENVTIHLLKSGNWIEVETEEMGSYLAFAASGAEVEFVAVSTAFPWVWVAVTIGAGAALILLLLLLRRFPKLRWGLLIPLLIAAILAGLWLLPQSQKAADVLRAWDILQEYLAQPEQAMTLQVDAKVASTDISLSADIHRQLLEDIPVTAITENDRTLYYGKECLISEDGTAYLLSESTPDYSQLLDRVGQLYSLVDVESVNGTYTLTTTEDQAKQLLELLLPSVNGIADGISSLTIDLTTTENALQEIHFTGAGNLADSVKTSFSVSARLAVTQPQVIPIPEAVAATLRRDHIQPKQGYSDGLSQLLKLWNAYYRADTLGASVQLTAECGKLHQADSFQLYQWKVDDGTIFGISQDDATLYFSGDQILDQQGDIVAGKALKTIDLSSLLELVNSTLESATFQQKESEDGIQYQLTLSPEGMDKLVPALLPDTGITELTWKSGSLILSIQDETITSLSISCTGTAKIALLEGPLALTVEIIPTTAPALPAALTKDASTGETSN